MNISEQKDIDFEDGDLLVRLFALQTLAEKDFALIEGFPERLVFGKLENLNHPEVCKHISVNILWRLVQEVAEATVALQNAKTWRQSKYLTDVNEYLDEVADIQIYLINLCLASGIDANLLSQIVAKKILVNKKRMESKY